MRPLLCALALFAAVCATFSACGPVAIGAAISSAGGGGSASPFVTVGSSQLRANRFTASRELTLTYATFPSDAVCEFQVDGQAWQAAPGNGQLTVLVPVDGEHELVLRQRNSPDVKATFPWFVDTVDPTAPTGILATSTVAHALDLVWSAATDPAPASEIELYEVTYQGGGAAVTLEAPGTTLSLSGLEAARSYSISVRAMDRAGRLGPAATISARVDAGGDGTFVAAAVRASNLSGASALAHGDFDRDRIADLAIVQTTGVSSSLAVLRGGGSSGRGDGQFAAVGGSYSVPLGAVLSTVDANSDRNLDVVVAGASGASGEVRVLLGAGNGQFAVGSIVPVASPVTAILAVDADDDAIGDLVIGTQSGNVFWLRGLGANGVANGGFANGATVAVGGRVRRILGRDFDDDRQLDLLVASDVGLYLVRGTGGGTFGVPARRLATEVPAPADLLLLDVNGDRIPDPVALSADRTRVLVAFSNAVAGCATGDFTFGNEYAVGGSIAAFASGDFNSDAIADLVAVSTAPTGASARLLRGRSGAERGRFDLDSSTVPCGASASQILVEDFDARGTLDVAVANPTEGTLSLLRGRGGLGVGNGSFADGAPIANAPLFPFALVAADFDRDGIQDFAYSLYGGAGDILVQRGLGSAGVGNGTFSAPLVLPNSQRLCPVMVATDLNGDRIDDLVAANTDPTSGVGVPDPLDLTAFLGRGDGSFAAPTQIPVGFKPRALTANIRRGRSDLGVAGFAQASVGNARILLDTRAAACTPQPALAAQPDFLVQSSSPPFVPFCYSTTTADFNGDGIFDLAVAGAGSGAGSGRVFVYAGIGSSGVGTGSFQTGAPAELTVDFDPIAVRAGDFDGDGKVDLLVVSNGSVQPFVPGSFRVFFGRGDGGFESTPWSLTDLRPSCLAIADFNGDGIADVAAGLNPGTQVRILLGNGNRSTPFTAIQSVSIADLAGTLGIVATDFDSDGIQDLLLVGSSSSLNGRIVLLLGRGTYPLPLQ